MKLMKDSRSRDKIAELLSPLGRHLLKAISSGVIFHYAPERAIDWLLFRRICKGFAFQRD